MLKYEKRQIQMDFFKMVFFSVSIVYIFQYLCWNIRYLAIRGIWYTYIILLIGGEWRGNTDELNLVYIAQNIKYIWYC